MATASSGSVVHSSTNEGTSWGPEDLKVAHLKMCNVSDSECCDQLQVVNRREIEMLL